MSPSKAYSKSLSQAHSMIPSQAYGKTSKAITRAQKTALLWEMGSCMVCVAVLIQPWRIGQKLTKNRVKIHSCSERTLELNEVCSRKVTRVCVQFVLRIGQFFAERELEWDCLTKCASNSKRELIWSSTAGSSTTVPNMEHSVHRTSLPLMKPTRAHSIVPMEAPTEAHWNIMTEVHSIHPSQAHSMLPSQAHSRNPSQTVNEHFSSTLNNQSYWSIHSASYGSTLNVSYSWGIHNSASFGEVPFFSLEAMML